MIAFLSYALFAYGFAYIVGRSEISHPLREAYAKWMTKDPVIRCVRCGGERVIVMSAQDEDNGMMASCPECHEERWHDIIDRFRPGMFLLRLVECPACFGFWIGFIAGLTLGVNGVGQLLGLTAAWRFVAPFILGCTTAASNLIVFAILVHLVEDKPSKTTTKF